MGNKTQLYASHQESGAKIVDFGGWDMPLHYGSQLNEHHVVRQSAGMFDVSHMTIVDVRGSGARAFLQFLLANDVAKCKTPGKALYSCMLNETGGVVDDLITYYMSDDWYRVVVNASTRDKDMAWIERHAKDFDVVITERPEFAMIAVQGPNAISLLLPLLPETLATALQSIKPFNAVTDGDLFVARTGYTGEDGVEMIVPGDTAADWWEKLIDAGVAPCGLGARDTLRLEAGMPLYGNDMDEATSPLQAGLGWTVAWEPADRDFIGRKALEKQQADGLQWKQVGLVLLERGVLRGHQHVVANGQSIGEITSGTFSPTLQRGIALARVPRDIGERCEVDIRGKAVTAAVVKPPFVRNGKSLIDDKI